MDPLIKRLGELLARLEVIDRHAELHWDKLEFTLQVSKINDDDNPSGDVQPNFRYIESRKEVVLKAVRMYGPANISLLARATGMNRKTVTDWLDRLGYGKNSQERRKLEKVA